MMKNTKLFTLAFICLCFNLTVFAQQPPTWTSPGGSSSGKNDKKFWSRAGNNNIKGSNNIFGTLWDSPIYTVTNGINRMTVYSGTNTPTDGRVAIGNNLPLGFLPADKLHLRYTFHK